MAMVRRHHARWRLLVAGAVGLLAGCATTVAVPPVADPVPQAPQQAYSVWAQVLAGHVDGQGRVDFRGVAADPDALHRFVAWVAEVGPDTQPALFPDQQAKLAYHLNAYNALAMYSVIDYGFPKHLGLLDRVRFFGFREITVDGRRMSLSRYENDVIRAIPDARLHVALNCMAVSCPRLPREPFLADKLDQQLDAAAREFYNSSKHVRVDHDRNTVLVSKILDFYTEDFLAEAPSLIAYVNQYAQPPLPADYDTGFLDYDWTVNAQP